MPHELRMGTRTVGAGHPCYIVAEIGINHNGDLDTAKRLIDAAVLAGCDAVKFQKRTVDVVVCGRGTGKPRESPFGTTNGDLKRGLEFGTASTRRSTRTARNARSPGWPRAGTRRRSTSWSGFRRPATRSRRPR